MRLAVLCATLLACSDPLAPTDAADTAERTLATCDTTIGEGVASFFATYFRCVEAVADGDEVILATIGLPPHPSPYYDESHPNWTAFDTRDGARRQNPNVLTEQVLTLTVPVEPVPKGIAIEAALVDRSAGTSDEEYHAEHTGGTIGIALNGVADFHGVAAPGDDLAVEAMTFDAYEGHPENTGIYHYHGASPGPLEVLEAAGIVETPVIGQAEVELYGMMCDGTVVMGCTELDGSAPDDADFDAQNGHVHDLVDGDGAVQLADRYHTHVCPGVFADAYAPEIQYYTTCNGQ